MKKQNKFTSQQWIQCFNSHQNKALNILEYLSERGGGRFTITHIIPPKCKKTIIGINKGSVPWIRSGNTGLDATGFVSCISEWGKSGGGCIAFLYKCECSASGGSEDDGQCYPHPLCTFSCANCSTLEVQISE